MEQINNIEQEKKTCKEFEIVYREILNNLPTTGEVYVFISELKKDLLLLEENNKKQIEDRVISLQKLITAIYKLKELQNRRNKDWGVYNDKNNLS